MTLIESQYLATHRKCKQYKTSNFPDILLEPLFIVIGCGYLIRA